VKKIVCSPRLLARAVFADPVLTLELPPKVNRGHGHGRADALQSVDSSFVDSSFFAKMLL
jgi:alcohol dehydrogenase class IV